MMASLGPIYRVLFGAYLRHDFGGAPTLRAQLRKYPVMDSGTRFGVLRQPLSNYLF